MRGIRRSPVDTPHKGPIMRKKFPFDNVVIRKFIHPHSDWSIVNHQILEHIHGWHLVYCASLVVIELNEIWKQLKFVRTIIHIYIYIQKHSLGIWVISVNVFFFIGSRLADKRLIFDRWDYVTLLKYRLYHFQWKFIFQTTHWKLWGELETR